MPTKKRLSLGAFTNTNAGTAFDLSGGASLARQSILGATLIVSGTFVATFTLQISGDGTNYVSAPDANGDAIAVTTESATLVGADGIKVRGKCSDYTSGTVNAYLIFP